VPSWTREVIAQGDYLLGASASTLEIFSDAASGEEHGYAQSVRVFVDIESIDMHTAVDVYRLGGPAGDKLRSLDASPALTCTAEGVERLDWAEPLLAYGQLRLVIRRTFGSGSRAVTLRVLHCYLVD
jgi:hypothetical protein